MITALSTSFIVFGLCWGHIAFPWLSFLLGMVFFLVFFIKRKAKHRHSLQAIDVLAQRSRLCHIHPAIKIIFSTICIILSVSTNEILLSFCIGGLTAVITIYVGKTPFFTYLSMLTVPLSFILLGGIGILYSVSAVPIGWLDISVGNFYISVTAPAQQTALTVMAKAFGALGGLYFLSFSTPMIEIISFLKKIHLPNIMIELMYFIYRYIFILTDVQQEMTHAASVRLGYRTLRTTCKTAGYVAANLLVFAFRQASTSFDAMETRCYEGQLRFLHTKHAVRPPEVICFSTLTLGLILVWATTIFRR